MVFFTSKQLQIVLVALIFSSILAFAVLSPLIDLAVIDSDRVVGKAGNVEVTTGDVLTVFGVFGSTVTVAIWLSSYYRGRK